MRKYSRPLPNQEDAKQPEVFLRVTINGRAHVKKVQIHGGGTVGESEPGESPLGSSGKEP